MDNTGFITCKSCCKVLGTWIVASNKCYIRSKRSFIEEGCVSEGQGSNAYASDTWLCKDCYDLKRRV